MREHFHCYTKRMVEVTCCVMLWACLGIAAESEVRAPKGAPPVIDGVVNEAEWAGAATRRLSDGTAIRFRHDGRHLFLGITATRRRFASVCIADRDTVRVFHASAALGAVSYTRSGREWATGDTEFVYGMRNTGLDRQAQQERKEYLARHGWLASTVKMGDGLAQELQISVGQVSRGARIAVAFYLLEGDSGSVVAWPEGLASDDACVDERLVHGYVPPRLGFKPNAWAALKFDNTDQKNMNTKPQTPLEPRKTPVQERSTVTVEAIYEATFQVLLALGADRLTTTRVAERAGVSVGTLYQYFPNKQSLLSSALEKHVDRVVSAVELACRRNHGQPLSTMIESVVEAFVDAKLERSDISMALYAAAVGARERALVNKAEKRARAAMASMLATAPNTEFADLPFTSLMLFSAMGGATRAVLEAGSSPRMARMLRKQLVLLCRGFLMSVAAQDRNDSAA